MSMTTCNICGGEYNANRLDEHCCSCVALERQVAALTKERDGWKQQCEDHCGTISGLLRENMEKHQVYCPHCNPCRHAEQLAAAQAALSPASVLTDGLEVAVPPAPTFDKDEDMNVRQVLLDAGLNVFGADLLAESFLKSPIAKQALEKGDPVRFFLPVRRSDCAEFVGVEISIAAVPVEVTANVDVTGASGAFAAKRPCGQKG